MNPGLAGPMWFYAVTAWFQYNSILTTERWTCTIQHHRFQICFQNWKIRIPFMCKTCLRTRTCACTLVHVFLHAWNRKSENVISQFLHNSDLLISNLKSDLRNSHSALSYRDFYWFSMIFIENPKVHFI